MSPPAHSRRRASFVPKARGALSEALTSVEDFLTVAPSVPRSVAWLRDRTLAKTDGVTARDISLFEALIALTATSEETEASIRAARLCFVASALTVLSAGGHDAQPRELVAALGRLFGRKPKPLKRGAMFDFHIPPWAVPLRQPGSRYAHVDLSVLARFRRRSSSLLYREVLAHVAAERIRYEPGMVPFVMEYSPEDLAAALGMPEPAPGASLHVGQLRIRYLAPALEEIAEHVRAFEIVSVSTEHKTRRRAGAVVTGDDGYALQARAVASIALTIRLCPPERLDAVPTRLLSEETFASIRERRDAPSYAVKPETIVRLGSSLPSARLRNRKTGRAAPLLQSEMRGCHDLWLTAIHEALTGEAITPAFETGAYRGQRLLDAIARDGADRAFWVFSHAEAAAPDIGPAVAERYQYKQEVEKARKARLAEATTAAAQERRRTVRIDRADGMMPPAKKRIADSPKVIVPEPVRVPTPAIAPPPKLSPELLAALSSPEGRAEGERLYQDWSMAVDYPFKHAGLAVERICKEFAGGRYPILAAVNEAVNGYYLATARRLLNMTPEKVPGITNSEREENASHAVIMLARAWLIPVSKGKSIDPYSEIDELRQHYKRNSKAAWATHKATLEAAAVRALTPKKPVSDGFRDSYVPKRAS